VVDSIGGVSGSVSQTGVQAKTVVAVGRTGKTTISVSGVGGQTVTGTITIRAGKTKTCKSDRK
jgi:hypothetical protein